MRIQSLGSDKTSYVSDMTASTLQSSEATVPLTAISRASSELKKLELSGQTLPLGEDKLLLAIERSIKAIEGPHTTLEMSVHEKTDTIMVKVINKDTGELLREIPPEKILDLTAKMMEFAGILVDKKV